MPEAKRISASLTIKVRGDITETIEVDGVMLTMSEGTRDELHLAIDAVTAQLVRRIKNFWPEDHKSEE